MVTILHWLVYFLIILEIRQRKIIWHTNHRNMKIIHLCWSTFQLIFIHFRDLPFPIHFLHCIQRLRFVMMPQNHLLLKKTKTWQKVQIERESNFPAKNNQVDLKLWLKINQNVSFWVWLQKWDFFSLFKALCSFAVLSKKCLLYLDFFPFIVDILQPWDE